MRAETFGGQVNGMWIIGPGGVHGLRRTGAAEDGKQGDDGKGGWTQRFDSYLELDDIAPTDRQGFPGFVWCPADNAKTELARNGRIMTGCK